MRFNIFTYRAFHLMLLSARIYDTCSCNAVTMVHKVCDDRSKGSKKLLQHFCSVLMPCAHERTCKQKGMRVSVEVRTLVSSCLCQHLFLSSTQHAEDVEHHLTDRKTAQAILSDRVKIPLLSLPRRPPRQLRRASMVAMNGSHA